jgi:hypothetical protein
MANYWDDPRKGRTSGVPTRSPVVSNKERTARLIAEALGAEGVSDPNRVRLSDIQDPKERLMQWAAQQEPVRLPTSTVRNGMQAISNTTPIMGSSANAAEHSAGFPDYFDTGKAANLFSNVLAAGTGAANDLLDSGSDLGPAPNSMTPEEILNMLRKQYGTYKYGGPSAETMTAREFDPQFAALTGAEGATRGRYKDNSAQMQGLYAAYANDVLKGRGETQKAYQDATNSINQTYSGAQSGITNSMNAATKEMGAQLKLLNQGEAAPAVMQTKQQVLGQQLRPLAEAQGASAALSTQLGANAYASDTARHGIAQQAGLNAQADLNSQLEGLMQDYSQQRLNLTGERGKARNAYGMNIEELIQQGNQGINESIAKGYGDTLTSQDRDEDRYGREKQAVLDRILKTAQIDLDKEALDRKYTIPLPGSATSAKQQNLNPYDAMLERSKAVNSDPQEASNDAEILFQGMLQSEGDQTIQTLMNYIEENNPGWMNQPGNKELAYQFFSDTLKAQKK